VAASQLSGTIGSVQLNGTYAAPRPRLSIAPAGGSALVSWPLFAQDFQLDYSDLSNPVTWSAAPYGYVTNATSVAVTAPAGAGRHFFRLRK